MKFKLFLLGLLSISLLTACGNPPLVKGIDHTYLNDTGELVVVYTDGTEDNVGSVKGKDGKDGINGQDGKDGKDGVDGKDGKDGINGQDGKDGKDGINGQDGKDGETITNIIEVYNDYYEQLVDAIQNTLYCDSSEYQITTEGWTASYVAIFVQGESGHGHSITEYHSIGATIDYVDMWGVSEMGLTIKSSYNHHRQICAIERDDNVDYTQYLPKPYNVSISHYHGEDHLVEYYAPSDVCYHTLGNKLGLHILKNIKVECISDKTAINYQGSSGYAGGPMIRTVISYEADFWIGGLFEEIKNNNL